MARVIAITSGKGGVGKSNLAVNLACALSDRAEKTCLFDADTGLANVNVLLGVRPELTLADCLEGQRLLDDVIFRYRENFDIIPAASGIAQCANLEPEQRSRLIRGLADLDSRYDYILIDTAAGVENNVQDFLLAAGTAILVITPEPTSLTDAFSLIKILRNRGADINYHVLVNMSKDRAGSLEVFNRFQAAVKNYLSLDVHYLGYVPLDEALLDAVSLQAPVAQTHPGAPASLAIKQMAEVVLERLPAVAEASNFSRYWNTVENKRSRQTLEPLTVDADAPEDSPGGTYDSPSSEMHSALPKRAGFTPALTRESIESQIETYIKRFSAFPFDTIQALYRDLEIKGFPENDLKEICGTLETIYERCHERPIKSPDSTIVQLLANVRESDEKIRQLTEFLRSSYERQFDRRLIDPLVELERWISEDDFTEADFVRLLEEARGWFHVRFGKPYEDEKDRLIKELRTEIDSMGEREAVLQTSAESLMEALRSLRDSKMRLDELAQRQ
ncbi:MinD/ParA family protein [Methylocaldum sp.]|uniref:MinD/ParA family protein n=1 Tax=Methylocaldum sp. TaxID=1969727 RepID=UPI002D449890|nr:MinD/ParA family protein [Methylocaldum sp.]HYE36891.1 MinD/ParA family protein [Methylocaldum sp.]